MVQKSEIIAERVYGDNEQNLDKIEEAFKIILRKCEEYVRASQAS